MGKTADLLQKVLLDAIEAHIQSHHMVENLFARLSPYVNPDEKGRLKSREEWNQHLGIRLQAACTLEAVFDVDTVCKILNKVENGKDSSKVLRQYLKKL